MSNELKQFILDAKRMFPKNETFRRPELLKVKDTTENNKGYLQFTNSNEFRLKHGVYQINEMQRGQTQMQEKDTQSAFDNTPTLESSPASRIEMKQTIHTEHVNGTELIPESDPLFVPFGDFRLVLNFLKSKTFFPIYISGESGNGKTKLVYEACAKAKRELIRANITETTDEDDLLGGFRLVNGETVWQNGPAISAMERGAILLLDEINLGSPKIMCLQPILEGNPIYLKKINKLIYPQPGFNVIATANTKGKGSDDGRYIGSNIQNEAFLDRFAITIEHEYPSKDAEEKILKNILTKNNIDDPKVMTFASKLVEWANIIRSTFKEGAIDEIITTRRLIHIINFYIFGKSNKMTAINYAIARFDDETKASIRSLYQKVDETIVIDKDNNVIEEPDKGITEFEVPASEKFPAQSS